MDASKLIAISCFYLLGVSVLCGIIIHFFKTSYEEIITKVGIYSFYLAGGLAVLSVIIAAIFSSY